MAQTGSNPSKSPSGSGSKSKKTPPFDTDIDTDTDLESHAWPYCELLKRLPPSPNKTIQTAITVGPSGSDIASSSNTTESTSSIFWTIGPANLHSGACASSGRGVLAAFGLRRGRRSDSSAHAPQSASMHRWLVIRRGLPGASRRSHRRRRNGCAPPRSARPSANLATCRSGRHCNLEKLFKIT